MPDREKVIKGLEYCEEYFNCCDKCPYWDGGTHCTADLAHDALALLKEQEHKDKMFHALEDDWERLNELLNEQEEKAGKWIPVTNGRGGMECSICHDYAPSYQNGAEYLSKYCPNCGAKMEGR